MRTTLNLDEDILRAATVFDRDPGIALGDTVSELARQGIRASRTILEDDGFPIFSVPPDAPPITLEDVRRAEDEPW